jgi:hypothetical protein
MNEELSQDAKAFIARALRQEAQVTPELSRSINRGVMACVGAASVGAATASASAATGSIASVLAGIVGKGSVLVWLASGGALGSVTAGVALWVAPDSPKPSEHVPALSRTARSPRSPAPRADSAGASRNIGAPAAARHEPERAESSHAHATAPASVAAGSTSAGAAAPSKAESASLVAELALLEKAQHELRAGHGQSALMLLDRPPPGTTVLTDERLTIEILAACQTGERARARQAADRLVARSPESPLVERARHSCAFAPDGLSGEP